MWNVLRLYGIGVRLLGGVESLYVGSKACVRVGNEVSEWFPVRVGLRQGCVMSPWLFNLYIDGVVREVNARVLGRGLKLVDGNENEWELIYVYVYIYTHVSLLYSPFLFFSEWGIEPVRQKKRGGSGDALDEITNRIFEDLLKGKSQQNFDELGIMDFDARSSRVGLPSFLLVSSSSSPFLSSSSSLLFPSLLFLLLLFSSLLFSSLLFSSYSYLLFSCFHQALGFIDKYVY